MARYIINEELVTRELTEKSFDCYRVRRHTIKPTKIGDTVYQLCEHCGLIAHSDDDYSYMCWDDWCRCSS
jgi:hypothetical protein